MTPRILIRLQQDLRLTDNPALDYASRVNAKVLFVYVLDDKMPLGGASAWYLHQALLSLQKELQQSYQAQLLLVKGQTAFIIPQLCVQYQITEVVYNRILDPISAEIDSELQQQLDRQGVSHRAFASHLLFEPATISNQSNQYYKVFTPFWRHCLSLVPTIEHCVAKPQRLQLIQTKPNGLTLDDLQLQPTKPNWAKDWHQYWQVDTAMVQKDSLHFINQKEQLYAKQRDLPAVDATSRLSPCLHFGLISPRQIYWQLLQQGVNVYQSTYFKEIGWREFSYYLLYHFPKLAFNNFQSKFDQFPWNDNPQLLKQWQFGQTGIPLVDAGMRQLIATGWMHNRVRMVVGSFLTKNLMIDWRQGLAWFHDYLVDADIASNAASWQWVAGSGSDAMPYFRIFNPILQAQKFDPNAEYIKRWVPELRNANNNTIFNLATIDGYVKPIVDLKKSRRIALQSYSDLK